MRNIVLVVLSLVVISLLVLVVSFYQKANKLKISYDAERYNRMVAEESSQKNAAKLATLENQLKIANEKMLKVQDLIDQEKSINGDLQRQFDALSKIKSDLENKLKTVVEEKPASVVTPQPTETNNSTGMPVEATK